MNVSVVFHGSWRKYMFSTSFESGRGNALSSRTQSHRSEPSKKVVRLR
jgi:hypothetical protein